MLTLFKGYENLLTLFKGYENFLKGSENFSGKDKGSENFREIGKGSENFRKTGKGSEIFRKTGKGSENFWPFPRKPSDRVSGLKNDQPLSRQGNISRYWANWVTLRFHFGKTFLQTLFWYRRKTFV